MKYDNFCISELQTFEATDDRAMAALGRKVLDLQFCESSRTMICKHESDLIDLQNKLDLQPPKCPHCGQWLASVKGLG